MYKSPARHKLYAREEWRKGGWKEKEIKQGRKKGEGEEMRMRKEREMWGEVAT